MKHSGGAKTANTGAWARRAKAFALISSTDPAELRKALTLFEPTNQPVAAGQEGKALENPEDLQVLARVLDAQRTPQHCQRAIEILESLVRKNFANLDDRFLLARLYEVSGDWLQAREEYHELILRTENSRDMETLNHRLVYINQFASSLLRHRQFGRRTGADRAQELSRQAQADPTRRAGTPSFSKWSSNKAQNRLDKADGLIQAFANRPGLTPVILASPGGAGR